MFKSHEMKIVIYIMFIKVGIILQDTKYAAIGVYFILFYFILNC